MGSKNSTSYDQDSIDRLYALMKGEVYGSDEAYEGGVSLRSKEALIEMFYELLRRKLNIGKNQPEAVTIEDKVEFINEHTPTRKKGFRRIQNADASFDRAMREMAKSV